MGRQRHLAKAPIREALIDLQFEPIAGAEAALTTFAGEFSAAHGVKAGDIWETLLEISVAPPLAPQATGKSGATGKRVDLIDRKQVFQFRNGGFTFSQLKPYANWAAMLDTAHPVWTAFFEAMGVRRLNRVAVRYINAVPLPLPLVAFEDYLTASPGLPQDLPQGFARFFTRLVIPIDAHFAVVTQALEGEHEVEGKKWLQTLIDIDVFRQGPTDARDQPKLLETLETLRGTKNRFFFALLTERALEMFE